MPKQETRPTDKSGDRRMDPKVVFDAGYNSYEDGKGEFDFGGGSEPSPVDPNFFVLWRSGWRRAHEDSALSRRDVKAA